MLSKKIIYFLILLILLISCKSEINYSESIKINSPSVEYVYYDDTNILFSIKSSKKVSYEWISSIDGKIGEGNNFYKCLSKGEHKIDIYENNELISSVNINVYKRDKNFFSLINESSYTLNKSDFGLLNLSNLSTSVFFNGIENTKANENEINNKRMFYINRNENCKKKLTIIKRDSRNIKITNENVIKNFYVINTKNQYSDPHIITAEKYFEGNKINVYISSLYKNKKNLIDECINEFEDFLFQRVESLWGKCTDINNDKHITILFTPTINEEGVAIGFFNSNDFFLKDDDSESEFYNPYSNEMDIIYIAIPDENNSDYSVNSICATMVHEYTHAINFSMKSWNNFIITGDELFYEELFLDEGLSHLSESLCGFGNSGGNINFVNYYLSNTGYYSLSNENYLGQNDSVGQRGGVCLFLYYLFNKAGGIEYSENEKNFIDKGGISFLKKMNSSKLFGWDCIGEYFGQSTDVLFLEYVEKLYGGIDSCFPKTKIDPYTHEYLMNCNNVTKTSISNYFKLLPKSFVFFNNLEKKNVILKFNSSFSNIYYY